jgi:hypothetical protein
MPPRQQTQPLQPAPGLTPVARPVDTYNQPGMVQIGQPDGNNALIQLGQALKEISPSLNQSLEQYGMMKQKEDVDMGRLLAQRNSTLTTLQELIDKKIITPGMSPAVRKGAMEGLALNAGAVYEAYLKDAWSKSEVKDTDDFEALRTFLGDQRNEFLKKYGQNDPDWATTFQAAATNGERYLSFEHTRHRQQETENTWRRTYEANLGHLVNAEVGKGALFNIDALVDQIRLAQDERRLQGMSWSDIHDATRSNLLAAYEATGDDRIITALQKLPLADGKTYKDSQIVNAAIDRAIQQRQAREEALDNRSRTKKREEDRERANGLKNRLDGFIDKLEELGVDDLEQALRANPDYSELAGIDREEALKMREYARTRIDRIRDINEDPNVVNKLLLRADAGQLSREEVRGYAQELRPATLKNILEVARSREEMEQYIDRDSGHALEQSGLANAISSLNQGFMARQKVQGDVNRQPLPAGFASEYMTLYKARVTQGLRELGPDPSIDKRNEVYRTAAERTLADAKGQAAEYEAAINAAAEAGTSAPSLEAIAKPLPKSLLNPFEEPTPSKEAPEAPKAATEPTATQPVDQPQEQADKKGLPPLLNPGNRGTGEDADYWLYVRQATGIPYFNNSEEGFTRFAATANERVDGLEGLIKALEAQWGSVAGLDKNNSPVMVPATNIKWPEGVSNAGFETAGGGQGTFQFPWTRQQSDQQRQQAAKILLNLYEMRRLYAENIKKYNPAEEGWKVYGTDRMPLDKAEWPLKPGTVLTPKMLLEDMPEENRKAYIDRQMWREYPVVPNILWLNKLEEDYKRAGPAKSEVAPLLKALRLNTEADHRTFFADQRRKLEQYK